MSKEKTPFAWWLSGAAFALALLLGWAGAEGGACLCGGFAIGVFVGSAIGNTP